MGELNMPMSKTVYCQILGDTIPFEVCRKEQGQTGCRGCNASSRLCETCKQTRSTHTDVGLCNTCYERAKEQKFCQHCMKVPTKGYARHCQNCMNRLKAPAHRESQKEGGPWSCVRIVSLLDKVRTVISTPGPVSRPLVRHQPPEPYIASVSPPEPIAQPSIESTSEHESDTERWHRFLRDPHFSRWYDLVAEVDARRTVRMLEPMYFKPKPRRWCRICTKRPATSSREDVCLVCCKKPASGSRLGRIHPSPSISQEGWIRLMLDRYAEEVKIGGADTLLVLRYAQTYPLDPVTLDKYLQDDRVVLLRSKHSRRASRHCLICETAEEARDFLEYEYSDDDSLFKL